MSEDKNIYIAANKSYINTNQFMEIYPKIGECVMLNYHTLILRLDDGPDGSRFERCIFIWKDDHIQLMIDREISYPKLDIVNKIVSGEYQKISSDIYYSIKAKLQQTQIECYYTLVDCYSK